MVHILGTAFQVTNVGVLVIITKLALLTLCLLDDGVHMMLQLTRVLVQPKVFNQDFWGACNQVTQYLTPCLVVPQTTSYSKMCC